MTPWKEGVGSRVLTQKPRETRKTSLSNSLHFLLWVQGFTRDNEKNCFYILYIKSTVYILCVNKISAPPPMPSYYISSGLSYKDKSGEAKFCSPNHNYIILLYRRKRIDFENQNVIQDAAKDI